jgi:hypothetical protein
VTVRFDGTLLFADFAVVARGFLVGLAGIFLAGMVILRLTVNMTHMFVNIYSCPTQDEHERCVGFQRKMSMNMPFCLDVWQHGSYDNHHEYHTYTNFN